MRFEQSLNKLFTNKYFLYVMVFFSMLTILGYLLINNVDSIVFFILVGIITSSFSKNMAIILAVCLLTTNVFMAKKIHEGFSGKNNSTDEATTSDETTTKSEPTDSQKQMIAAAMMAKKEQDSSESDTSTTTTSKKTRPTNDQGDIIEPEEKFRPMREREDAKLDYGSSIKAAYKDLNNILDPDAIKNLTSETMQLMKEQKKLMSSMNQMAPLMEQAESLIGGFDMSALKKFGGGAKNV